jgi:hypothetical protein
VPANLPPMYFEAEKRFRDGKTPEEKIYDLFVFAVRNGSAIIGSWLEGNLLGRCCSCRSTGLT